ncbi:sulfatase-like hydrolase/transferase [bacterium]|nr:sulfatase-like hydrolase/transferase [bacterium]
MKIRIAFLIIITTVCFLGLTAPPKPNVVLITIDTLRADRLGCYGYKSAHTPNIDKIAAEGVMFRNAISHVPLTRPSHASIFTGLFPFQHGIHDNIAPPLDAKISTLSEAFRKNGYRTAAFVSSFVINSQSGLQRGFDFYEDKFDPQKQPTDFALNLEKRAGEVFTEFQNWKSTSSKNPFFVWLHFYDPHFPYAPLPPYSKTFAERPYDGEIAYTDEIIGKTLKLLEPNTLLIITSDHGESLGEHGENAHSYFIYDATLRVPLIFHWPGKLTAKQSMAAQVRLVDLYPTILDLASIQSQSKISGISLKPMLNGEKISDPGYASYCETFTPWLHFGWSRLIGVRMNGWKYIDAPRAELFNLANDPNESSNIYSKEKKRADDFKKWLINNGALEYKAPSGSPAQEIDPEQLEKLASLGYAGGANPPPSATGKLADPKDKIEDFKLFNRLIREGIEDFQAKRYQQAASKFQILRDRQIPSFEVYYYLGRSLLLLKSYDKSSTELELAIQKLPHFLPAYRDLAELKEAINQPAEAEKALLRGLAITPAHPILVQPLAWLYQRQKRYKEAENILQEELKKYPDDKEGRYRLAAIYRDTERPDQALLQFQQILQKYPNEAEAYNQMGMIYGARGQLQQAEQFFTRAAELAPKDEAIRKNLELLRTRMAMRAEKPVRFQIIQTRSRAAAETILRKLKQGEDWNRLARDYSVHPSARSGSSILETTPAELDPALRQPLAALQPGQTSEVIEAKSGFFLLRRELN